MVGVDLSQLLRRLNSQCTRALHGAAGLAVSASHYEVTIEHLLLQMLEEPQLDLHEIFRHFDVEGARVQAACSRALEGLRSGNSGKPVFSPPLLSWFEEAFLVGGIEFSQSKIRSGTLLLALVAKPGRTTVEDHTDELGKIRVDELRRDFAHIIHGSSEDDEAVSSEEPVAGDRPGAAQAAASGEEALARFTIDKTAAAREGQVDPVLGRDVEIRQMIDVLTRRRKNNPMIVGEAGVGKTAVVEGFALRVAEGDVPDSLADVRVLSLDLGLLQAGAGMKGEFENRLKNVISEVKASTQPTILFIDEAHTLIGAGGSAGTGDAANLLKPPLARGELRTIGATTYSEFKKYIEKDPALERRFQPIQVDEPSVDTCTTMMRGVADKFEQHHNVKILDRAVEASSELSDRYISGRQLPDKAIDVLDTACARVSMSQSAKPGALDDLERRIANLEIAIRALESDEQEALEDRAEELASLRAERDETEAQRVDLEAQWTREREAVQHIRDLRSELDAARKGEPLEEGGSVGDPDALIVEIKKASEELEALQGEFPLVQVNVDPSTISQVVADWTGIPIGKMATTEAADALSLEEDLCERVVGQDHALQAIAEKVQAAKAGLKLPTQPMGVFLLVGPSGVGKTETGLAVADLLFGGERFMTTINMSEFMEKHTVSRLIGSPPGYVGYGEGGVLTEAVRHRPYSVVLLDEIEKAHPEVMNLFYQVFDKGTLSDGEGREVDFRNTILMMTSNLASDIVMEACNADEPPEVETLVEQIRPALQAYLKPALLGRMTVVPYYPLTREILRMIADLKMRKITKLMHESHGVEVEVLPEARDAIADLCNDPESGARAIDRVIDQHIMPRVSRRTLEELARGELPSRLEIGADGDGNFSMEFSD